MTNHDIDFRNLSLDQLTDHPFNKNLSLDFQKSFRLRIRQRFEPGTHTGGKDDGIVYMIRTERIIISVLKAVIELRLYHNERILL